MLGLSGWPLRRRLVMLVMALVGAGLLVAGTAAVAALNGYLVDQVDASLTRAATGLADPREPPVDRGAPLPLADDPLGGGGPVGQMPGYVVFWTAEGEQARVIGSAAVTGDPPVIPGTTTQEAVAAAGTPVTVPSTSGSTHWRVVTVPLATGAGSVSLAQDLGAIDATVTRLMLIEIAIGLVVLLVLGIAGRMLVGRSLRPLVDVEQAAAAIAAGDPARRAPVTDPRTEVGSLALHFNAMVDELHGALAAQRSSEVSARASAEVARASEERMRRFVADASHELRTPLTSVRGFAELHRLGAVAPGPAVDDAMARIEAEATRMGVLVEDLLVLARLEGARPLEVEQVDLGMLAADACAAALASAPNRTIQVHVRTGPAGLMVAGDAVRLRQVVDNLLSNALRYSPDDQPVVVRVSGLAVGPDDRPMSRVGVLEVADHGPGMTPEVASRVFERFFRADPARTRAAGGSGLGLAIVAAIVEAHGGQVEVDTAPGAGSTFRVLLPGAGSDQRQVHWRSTGTLAIT